MPPCVYLTFVCLRYSGWLFNEGSGKGSRAGARGLGVGLRVSASPTCGEVQYETDVDHQNGFFRPEIFRVQLHVTRGGRGGGSLGGWGGGSRRPPPSSYGA